MKEATRILASVMKHLWKPLPEKHDFITIAEWSNAISQYHGTSGPLPSYLVDKAERLFAELIASSAEPVLVHGDLHHENVLSSARAGWLAIDPKGVAAERNSRPASQSQEQIAAASRARTDPPSPNTGVVRSITHRSSPYSSMGTGTNGSLCRLECHR